MLPPFARRVPASKIEAEIPKALKPKVTGSKHNVTFKQEEIPVPPKVLTIFTNLAGKCISGLKYLSQKVFWRY